MKGNAGNFILAIFVATGIALWIVMPKTHVVTYNHDIQFASRFGEVTVAVKEGGKGSLLQVIPVDESKGYGWTHEIRGNVSQVSVIEEDLTSRMLWLRCMIDSYPGVIVLCFEVPNTASLYKLPGLNRLQIINNTLVYSTYQEGNLRVGLIDSQGSIVLREVTYDPDIITCVTFAETYVLVGPSGRIGVFFTSYRREGREEEKLDWTTELFLLQNRTLVSKGKVAMPAFPTGVYERGDGVYEISYETKAELKPVD